MSRITFLIVFLLCAVVVLGDVSYSGNIKIPEGAIDTSHCPCDPDIQGDWDAQIKSCEDCIRTEINRWVDSQQEPSQSILPEEHTQSEEIERLRKLRKKQAKQEAARVRAKEVRVGQYLGLLKGGGLTTTQLKDLLRTIDELVYDKRHDIEEINKLKNLKSSLFQQYAKHKKRVEEVQRKAEIKKATEEFFEKATEEAIKGNVDADLHGTLAALKEQGSFNSDEVDQIHDIIKEIEEMISKSYEVEGDESALDELLDLKEGYGRLLTGDKISDELAIQKSMTQGINFEVQRYAKSLKEPPRKDPKIEKVLENAKKYLNTNQAGHDRLKMWEAEMKHQEGEAKLDTANKIFDTREKIMRRDRILKNRYTEVLKKDKNNVEANFGLAQVLTNQGKHEESRVARMRAFFHAKPMERAKMNAELEERFQSKLLMAKKPARKNSLYLRRLRADFKDEFVEPANQPDLADKIMESEVMTKALEWAQKRAEPLQRQVDQIRGVFEEKDYTEAVEEFA